MNVFQALLALIALGGFLVVMIYHVPSPDLVIVIVLTFVFAAFDFYRTLRSGK